MDNKKLIHDTVVATLAALNSQPKPQDCYKATEDRLYAYPVLLENIKRYKLDIRDLKKEKNTEKSKDITCWGGASGIRLTPEEKQQARIMAVEVKLARDQAEVDKIDRILNRLEASEDAVAVDLIRQVYFFCVPLDDIALREGVSLSTIQRRRTRLVRQLALMLYGAEALM
ncbi:hypothetical protein [Phascolarctobacterium succinatutens]|uniref:hypothetical protein n=1 Tax=Phascolarctobacterium succinatutens TaxID=626940 RepID=UPI0026EBA3B9|nr:hypothetical protein [Phascolarctobacterium succinatutens]